MCLIFLAFNVHPLYKLILAANRDEFYERPSERACFREDTPHLLAGKDLRAGGTWLGITSGGRFSAITNYREKGSDRETPSRGALTIDYLLGSETAGSYLKGLAGKAAGFKGFNLLLGEKEGIYHYSNREGVIRQLAPGIYGLSNHLLDTPWPKVILGKRSLKNLLKENGEIAPEVIFAILEDRTIPADEFLPHTGVGLEKERMLAPVFITSPDYGTRSSTLFMIDRHDNVVFIEKTHGKGNDRQGSVMYEFQIAV